MLLVRKLKDTRTREQVESLTAYVLNFVRENPNVLVAAHSQFAAKSCPSFSVPRWLEVIEVPDKNIYRK